MLLAFAVLIATPVPWLPPIVLAAGVGVALLRIAARAGRALAREIEPAGTIALGRDRSGHAVSIAREELSAHGLVLGASGAGKTTTLLRILTEQIRAGRPVIAIDMKGSPAFARTLAEACHAAGRPFKRWTMEGGGSWNPLQYGNPTELKDKLIATERFSEPHYQRAAERYLQTALRVLQSVHPGRPATLEEVVQVLDPKRLSPLLRELPRDQADPVQDYLAGLTHDQHSAIRGLQTRLALITESQAGRFLSPQASGGVAAENLNSDAIDLRRALTGREVVLFSLNSSAYGKLASQLGTLAVQDLVSALGRQLANEPEAAPAATIAIDEFSGLGGDHVVALFARVREAGGGVLVATQEMADLERAASGLRDQVIGNTAFKVIHRQDVPSSARLAAQMGGTEPAWDESWSTSGGLFQRGSATRSTRRQVDRFILDPNEILSLRTGEAAVISKLRGSRPRVLRISPVSRPREPGRAHQRRAETRRDGPVLE